MAADTSRVLARNVPKLYAARLLFFCFLGTGVLVPFLRDWGELSYVGVMTMQAWFMVATFVLEVPSGSLADRFGRRLSIVSGALVGVLASFVLVSGPSLWTLTLGQLLLAVSYALFSGADVAMAYDTLHTLDRTGEAPRLYGRLESVKLVGFMLGSVIGAPLAARYGLEAPVVWRAMPFGLCAVVGWLLVEPPRGSRPDVTGAPRAYRELLGTGLRALRDPELRRLVWHSVLPETFLFGVLWVYQPLCEQVGIALGWFGTIHAALSLTQILWLWQIHRAGRIVGGERPLVFWTAIVAGVALLGLGLANSPAAVVLGILVTATFGLTRRPVFLAAFNSRIEAGERATVLSTINMVRLGAWGAILPIVGASLEWSISGTLCIMGAAALVATVLTRLPRGIQF